MTHYHIDVIEKDGKRVGALATTRLAAGQEKRIEEEGEEGRQAAIRECSRPCFSRPLQAV